MLSQSRRNIFTENVTQLVIERHLLKNLAEDTFSPKIVQSYDGEDGAATLAKLAAESKLVTEQRAELKEDLVALKQAREAFAGRLDIDLKRTADEMKRGDVVGTDIPYAKRLALD